MNIGLFFGSFNPIHVGHLIIAEHVLLNSDLNKVWLVVSPQNPFKNKKSLLNEFDRLHLVRLACDGFDSLEPSNFEFDLPKPSFTIDSLAFLTEKHKDHSFSLIMGGDSFISLPKWKNGDLILNRFPIFVYNRPNAIILDNTAVSVTIVDAPLLEISSSYIRKSIKGGKLNRFMLPKNVLEYIEEMNYYK